MKDIELKGGRKMEQKYVIGIIAIALVSVLGISIVSAHGFGFMNHELTDDEREDMQEQMDSIHEAIANGDYDTWASLMNERIEEMKSEINEDNFNSIVEKYDEMEQAKTIREELRNAVQEGDDETAQELRTQLQELMPQGKGNGYGIGMGHGFGHRMGPPEEMPFD